MITLAHIAVVSLSFMTHDTAVHSPDFGDSTLEQIMHWCDTTDGGDGSDEDLKLFEMDRYRYGPRLPDDDLAPTYYDSPWRRTDGA